jgi:hypothetical protein
LLRLLQADKLVALLKLEGLHQVVLLLAVLLLAAQAAVALLKPVAHQQVAHQQAVLLLVALLLAALVAVALLKPVALLSNVNANTLA